MKLNFINQMESKSLTDFYNEKKCFGVKNIVDAKKLSRYIFYLRGE